MHYLYVLTVHSKPPWVLIRFSQESPSSERDARALLRAVFRDSMSDISIENDDDEGPRSGENLTSRSRRNTSPVCLTSRRCSSARPIPNFCSGLLTNMSFFFFFSHRRRRPHHGAFKGRRSWYQLRRVPVPLQIPAWTDWSELDHPFNRVDSLSLRPPHPRDVTFTLEICHTIIHPRQPLHHRLLQCLPRH